MSDPSKTAELLARMCTAGHADAVATKRELWRVVRRAGRPGGQDDKSQVVAELNLALVQDFPSAARRELLWMLSEIGGDESVGSLAELLSNEELRDDARMALERIPGDTSLAALKAGLAAAADDFQANIAHSLRRRGVKVPGVPCQKLVPTKKTNVKGLVLLISAFAVWQTGPGLSAAEYRGAASCAPRSLSSTQAPRQQVAKENSVLLPPTETGKQAMTIQPQPLREWPSSSHD